MNRLALVLPILVAMAGIVTIPSAFAQTTTTTSTTSTAAHHGFHGFRGGGFGGGLGLGAAVILNPSTTSNVVCTNPLAPVPVQTTNGVYCLSASNAGTDVTTGVITTPTTPIIIAGTTFGGLGFGFHHGFHH